MYLTMPNSMYPTLINGNKYFELIKQYLYIVLNIKLVLFLNLHSLSEQFGQRQRHQVSSNKLKTKKAYTSLYSWAPTEFSMNLEVHTQQLYCHINIQSNLFTRLSTFRSESFMINYDGLTYGKVYDMGTVLKFYHVRLA